jgi:phenylpropionate dioxygenase-like ring-hydroxylating dioxygenase large terminal subunit
MFLRNHWYVAAWDHEIVDAVFARRILDEPIVLFRGAGGAVVAMEDRCPHRRAPLSMGKVVEGGIECLYHGIRFAPSGACARIPTQADIPAGMKVKTYPVVERHHWVWIWMGDPALADPATIPDFHYLSTPDEWGAKGTVMHVKAGWQLIVDNLLDLTHLATVHASTIGNAAIADKAETRVQKTERGVLMIRWVKDAPAPPTYVKAGGFTRNIDRWQYIDFTPPAFLRLHVGGADIGSDAGFAKGPPQGGIHMRNLNAITPETETTTHYFWGQAHNFDVHNAKLTEMIFSQVNEAFLEDVAIFEGQQRVIDRDRGPPEVDIAADAAQIQARRILTRLHEIEQTDRREAAE